MQKIESRVPGNLRGAYRLMAETFKGYSEDECTLRSAALAYYALLSFFPLLLFLLFIASIVITEGTRQALLAYVYRAVPQLAAPAIAFIEQTLSARASFGVLGAAGLMWTASALFAVLASTFSTIWEAKPRSLWRRRLMGLLMVLALAILFIFSLLLRTFLAFDLNSYLPISGRWLNILIDFGVTTLLLWVLYTWLPNRHIEFKASLSGALLAAFLWQLAKMGFSFYLSFGLERFGAVYGSLGSVIVLILWVYFSSMIIFLGAEFAAVLQLSRSANGA
ncbi:MAG: YihY/virulence factor BrkB family protein [Anaerolineales bacterium]